jgi:hypothetical protein
LEGKEFFHFSRRWTGKKYTGTNDYSKGYAFEKVDILKP